MSIKYLLTTTLFFTLNALNAKTLLNKDISYKTNFSCKKYNINIKSVLKSYKKSLKLSTKTYKLNFNKLPHQYAKGVYTIKNRHIIKVNPPIGFKQYGYASYYHSKFAGLKTSNGEKLNLNALTAAHKTLPFNTLVKVTNLRNGRSIIVRINDRGPFVKGRIIDLSQKAAKKLGIYKRGVAKIKLEVVS